jgi:hypothetical protein
MVRSALRWSSFVALALALALGADGRVHVTRDYQVRTACEDAVTRLKARGK